MRTQALNLGQLGVSLKEKGSLSFPFFLQHRWGTAVVSVGKDKANITLTPVTSKSLLCATTSRLTATALVCVIR